VNKDQLITRGAHAQRLLQDEVLNEAIRAAIAEKTEISLTDQRLDIREARRNEVLALRTILDTLQEYVDAAMFAKNGN